MTRSNATGVALALGLGGLACAGAPGPAPMPGPVIEAVAPLEGPAGTAYPIPVTILGRGFDPDHNVIHFASLTLEAPSDEGGTRIRFLLPKATEATGEVAPMILQPGMYEIRVETPRGTSDPVPFRLR